MRMAKRSSTSRARKLLIWGALGFGILYLVDKSRLYNVPYIGDDF